MEIKISDTDIINLIIHAFLKYLIFRKISLSIEIKSISFSKSFNNQLLFKSNTLPLS